MNTGLVCKGDYSLGTACGQCRRCLDAQIACLKREIALRERVYPKWIANGRMKEHEAKKEIAAMTGALHTLLALAHSRDTADAAGL